MSAAWVFALAALVAVQRLLELVHSRRNLRAAAPGTPAAGGRGNWVAMVAAHVGLVVLPPLEVALLGARAPLAVGVAALAVFAAAQALRYWTLATLGAAWNARGVVAPDQRVVDGGPYRLVRHPNYLCVLLEFLSVPAVGGAWISLVLLNLAHAPILAARVRAEERLLERLPGWSERVGPRGRFLPRLRAAPRAREVRP